jgi:hypothetical protein
MSQAHRLEITAQPDELALLAQLRAQTEDFLVGARTPNGAWLLANYLDLAEAFPAERRAGVYRNARRWLTDWAKQAHNVVELERLAARSWCLRRLNEQRLKTGERLIEQVVASARAKRKRGFVNAREEMAFVERTIQAHLRKRERQASARATKTAQTHVQPCAELRYGT